MERARSAGGVPGALRPYEPSKLFRIALVVN